MEPEPEPMGPPRRHALERLADERGELEAMRGVGEAPLHEQEAPHNVEFFALVADVKGVLSRLETKVHGKGRRCAPCHLALLTEELVYSRPKDNRCAPSHLPTLALEHLWSDVIRSAANSTLAFPVEVELGSEPEVS